MNQVSGSTSALSEGWTVFKGSMGPLIIAFVIYFAVIMFLSVAPVINFFYIVWMPPLWGGFFYIVIDAAKGQTVDYNRFLDGFREKFLQFFLVYLLSSIIAVIVILPMVLFLFLLVGGDTMRHAMEQIQAMEKMDQGAGEDFTEGGTEDTGYRQDGLPPGFGPVIKWIILGGMFATVFAIWFNWFMMLAFACVAGRGMGAIEAMGAAFSIMKSGVPSGVVTPMVIFLASVAGAIPFLLGLLIVVPWAHCVAVIAAGAVDGARGADGAAATGSPLMRNALHPSASSGHAMGAPPPIPGKYDPGSCAHCFVFQEGADMDDVAAKDYISAAHRNIIDSNQDMLATGHGLAEWPKDNTEFKKIAADHIHQHAESSPGAPNYMDGSKYKISVKTGKNPATGKRVVSVFIVRK
ncbi:MAG: hypothetical protein OEZ32_05500 [Nitrospinota bacterium]|nr:hypothetical protein [Nitrospinota bacterium]